MNLKTANLLKNIAYYAAMLVAAATIFLDLNKRLESGMLIGSVVLLAVGIVLAVAKCRCPHCGAPVSGMGAVPELCAHCKGKLTE